MFWMDEGYLLSKRSFDENSIIIETFTLKHGKYSGIVYGGSSRKYKKNFQIGNKIMLNMKAKSENKLGYFKVELIKPISPFFFDDKKKSICILSATTILTMLLPERQINKKIYDSFEKLLNKLNDKNWIRFYIFWELSLIKELGFGINFINDSTSINKNKNSAVINGKFFKIPELIINKKIKDMTNLAINDALIFNKNLLIENFIIPNKLRFPLSRNILQEYYI